MKLHEDSNKYKMVYGNDGEKYIVDYNNGEIHQSMKYAQAASSWIDSVQSKDRTKKMVPYKELMNKPEFTSMFDELHDNSNNKAALLLIMHRVKDDKDGPNKLIHDMANRMLNRLVAKGNDNG